MIDIYYLINKTTGEIFKQAELKGAMRRIQRKLSNKQDFKVSKFNTLIKRIKKEITTPIIQQLQQGKKQHQERLKYQRDNGTTPKKKRTLSLRKALRRGYHIHSSIPTKLYAK